MQFIKLTDRPAKLNAIAITIFFADLSNADIHNIDNKWLRTLLNHWKKKRWQLSFLLLLEYVLLYINLIVDNSYVEFIYDDFILYIGIYEWMNKNSEEYSAQVWLFLVIWLYFWIISE